MHKKKYKKEFQHFFQARQYTKLKMLRLLSGCPDAGKDYMSPQQKSILKHVDELALEISHGCTDIKKLKKKMENKM